MNFFKQFNIFLNENIINLNDIEAVLMNCKRGTKITFVKYNDNKVRSVYYREYNNGRHWANYSPELKPYQNDLPIYPNRHIIITKIGHNEVESRDDFDTRIEFEEERKKIEIQKKYDDAYNRSKKYPNVD